MRFLLSMGIVALASCGAPARNSTVQPTDGGARVRLGVTDAASGVPLAATASGANVSCLPDGADLLCSVPGSSRYPVDVSSPEHVTMPVWIGVATASSGNSMPSPIATRVAVSLWTGSGRFTLGSCPPCPLTLIPIYAVDAATGVAISYATATLINCSGDCACLADAGKLWCSAPGVGPLAIDVTASGYTTVHASVPVASFGNQVCCWGGTSVTVPLSRD